MSSNIVQSPLFGGSQGDAFNDLANVGGWPATQNIQKISKIVVRHGEIVDAITITYSMAGGVGPSTQSHGGPGGNETTITLSGSEYLVGISGQSGPVAPDFGATSIQKLQFIIVDKASGRTRLEPSTGSFAPNARKAGTAFSVDANTIVAFAGFTQVATSHDQGTRRFLQSLSVFYTN